MGTLLEGYRYCVGKLFWVWVPNACPIGDSLMSLLLLERAKCRNHGESIFNQPRSPSVIFFKFKFRQLNEALFSVVRSIFVFI
jgi:hypothetical protein